MVSWLAYVAAVLRDFLRRWQRQLLRLMIENVEGSAHAILPLLDARLVLYQHLLERDRRTKHAARKQKDRIRIMTGRGVDPIAALTVQAVLDDPARFKSSRAVAAKFGLAPRR